MHPMWKVYRSKVMQTLNPDLEDDAAEEVQEAEVSPVQEDEGPSAVTQLAKKVHVAGARGWNRMSALFSKEDEHQLLEETESPAVADHPLAVQPEDPRPARRSGFWDSFATKWQQKQAAAAAATGMEGGEGGEEVVAERGEEEVGEGGGEGEQEGQNAEGEESEGGGGLKNSFSKYASLGGGGGDDTAFKWNFVTSKLAELKTKGMTKTT
ncbi:uncharacterized protein C1orf232 [Osmerus mordax]|uniref:uncharacterized protein C1orf232 n=1 Tax=Osmerus mordax TaxID=8014 RepID=UPI00350EC480